ncbi:hypothetical protein FKP32DRAFT_1589832 [Trametes sanguinea]|nr:hypothetical protein FKP32DRAFT_1589832 [Trametes sanguinea]
MAPNMNGNRQLSRLSPRTSLLAMQALLQTLSSMSVTDLASLLTTRTLHVLPRLAKYFVLFLFLVQIRSWPLTWHYRVWHPVFALRGRFLLHRVANVFRSPEVRRQKNLEWFEGLSNGLGKSPFDMTVVYKNWAGPDDCDFNMHLSNSSYPKHLDAARFKYALECCPTFFRAGGWMGLGATHFAFLREIPMFSNYEMRVSIMSWDQKWVYIVTRYVTKPKGKGNSKKNQIKPAESPAAPSADAPPNPSLHTANGLQTGTSTPLPAGTSSSAGEPNAKALAAQLLERPEPDGAALRDFYTHGWREVPEGERWWEQVLGGEVEERRLKGLACMQAMRRGMEEARTI